MIELNKTFFDLDEIRMLRLSTLKNQTTKLLSAVKTRATAQPQLISQANYITYDEWKKLAKTQLKETPAESLVWKTPEVW